MTPCQPSSVGQARSQGADYHAVLCRVYGLGALSTCDLRSGGARHRSGSCVSRSSSWSMRIRGRWRRCPRPFSAASAPTIRSSPLATAAGRRTAGRGVRRRRGGRARRGHQPRRAGARARFCPHAARCVLVLYGDGASHPAVRQAIVLGQVDTYLLKPILDPEDRLYPVVAEMLGRSARRTRPRVPLLHLVSER
jgi:hypothetical protein